MGHLVSKNSFHASNTGAQLCFYLILWYVISAVLTGFLGFPKFIVYIGDLVNVWLFVKAIFHNHGKIYKYDFVFFCILLFSMIALFTGIANIKSPLLLLWGIRQNFRFFIYYYSCTVFLHKEDFQMVFEFVKYLFWVSLPLCAYEALMVKYPSGAIVGDYVGGIYYGIQGVNAPLNIILLVHCTRYLLDFYKKRHGILGLSITLGAALTMATLAELKIFLIEIIIIALFIMLMNGVSFKSIIIVIGGAFILGYAIQAFVSVNGQGRSYYTSNYLSISGMLDNAFRSSGYDGTGDLNRFFSVQTLTQRFFHNNMLGFMFGIGLGNAEYSLGFEMLTSSFYKTYNYLHYQYFSISFIFIETGILGLFSYFMIFILGFVESWKYLKFRSNEQLFFVIMIVMMMVLIFYNPSLRNEQCAFILYFILSLPIVYMKDQKRENDVLAQSSI